MAKAEEQEVQAQKKEQKRPLSNSPCRRPTDEEEDAKKALQAFFTAKKKEEEKEKKGRNSDKRAKTRQFLQKSGRLLFLLVLLVQNWLCVNAAAEGLQKRTEIMERWQQQ